MTDKQKAIVRRARHKATPPHEAVTAAKIALQRAKTPLERAQARVALNLATRRLAKTQKSTAIALMAAVVLAGCGDVRTVYVYPDSGPDVVDDGSVSEPDAGEVLMVDAGNRETDAGIVPIDTDAGTVADAGPPPTPDAGTPPPSCPEGTVQHPTRSDVCLVRYLIESVTCPSGRPLQWAAVDEQHALQAVLPALGGSGGTGATRRWGGPWLWPDGTGALIDWSGSTPGTSDGGYTYLTGDGVRAYHRAYSYLICMVEAS